MLTLINSIAVYALKEEVLDLPEKHNKDIFINYGKEFNDMARTLKNEHYLTKKNGEEVYFDSMGAKSVAMRKLRSGLIDDEVVYKNKFLEVLNIIQHHKRGVLIFTEFKSEADNIVLAIEHVYGEKVGRIYGEHMELENTFVTVASYSKAAESIDGLQHRNNVFVNFSPTNK